MPSKYNQYLPIKLYLLTLNAMILMHAMNIMQEWLVI